MKKLLLVFAFLVFALLMLPGLIRPPAESVTQAAVRVKALAHALSTALLEYREKNGHFPEGGEQEIMDELRTGGFFAPAREALNDRGELLDPWGTPYRIRFDTEKKHPIIQSAGRNQKFEQGHPMAFMSSDDHSHPQ